MTNLPAVEKITPEQLVQISDFAIFIDNNELDALVNQYPALQILHTRFEINATFMQFLQAKKPRRGEVVFVLQNDQQETLTHTKPQNPDGVYRLLTGGIDIGEDVESALHREVYEETGFRFQEHNLLGIIAAMLISGQEKYPFISYVYTIPHMNVKPLVMDESEKISGFRWVTTAGLEQIHDRLLHLSTWQDWGLLRSLPHVLIAGT